MKFKNILNNPKSIKNYLNRYKEPIYVIGQEDYKESPPHELEELPNVEFKQVIRYGITIPDTWCSKDGIIYSQKSNLILSQSKVGNKENYNNFYWSVRIRKVNGPKGKFVTTTVHRLVMETWKPLDEYPPESLADDWDKAPESFKQWVRSTAWVDHEKGNKNNNDIFEMKWTTPRGNNVYWKEDQEKIKRNSVLNHIK